MSTRDVMPGFALGLLADYLASRGVAIASVLDEARATDEKFDDPMRMIQAATVARVLNAAARQACDPDFGLGYGCYLAPRRAAVIGQIQLTAPTIRDLIEATVEFAPLALPALNLSLEDHGDTSIITAHLAPMSGVNPRQLIDFILAVLVTRIRRGVDARWTPIAVDLTYRRPDDARALDRLLGSAIRFAQSANRMEIANATLDTAFPGVPVGPFQMTCAYLRRLPNRAPYLEFPTEAATRREITKRLAEDQPVTLDAIATALARSPRSLQVQLDQEGCNFETVLLETRRNLAVEYLHDGDLPMAEIALRLGFHGPSVLSRWVLRHFGATPTQLRKRLREEPVATSIEADATKPNKPAR